KTTWAVGPVFNLPTTSDPALGSGKWGIGPTAIALWSTPHWTYGALVNHLWGLVDTGNVDRGNVSQTFLQPFLARHLPRAMTLTLSSESTYNWHAAGSEAWTVPVNLVVSKVTRLGPFPFSV